METKDSNFSQLCVWPGCIVGKDNVKDFESDMTKTFKGVRVKYEAEVLTNPDVKGGVIVPETGGRNDLFFMFIMMT